MKAIYLACLSFLVSGCSSSAPANLAANPAPFPLLEGTIEAVCEIDGRFQCETDEVVLEHLDTTYERYDITEKRLYRYKAQLYKKCEEHLTDGDLMYCRYGHYLKTHTGDIVELGEFKQLFGPGSPYVWRGLGLDTPPWRARSSEDVLFSELIFFDGKQVCDVYRMKEPFLGEVRNCGQGRETIQTTVAYPDDMITLRESRQMVCAFMFSMFGNECQNNDADPWGIKIYRNNGEVNYQFAYRRRLEPLNGRGIGGDAALAAVGYEHSIFNVDPYRGTVSFVEARGEDFDPRDW